MSCSGDGSGLQTDTFRKTNNMFWLTDFRLCSRAPWESLDWF